jgi:hypothetical protein
VGTVHVVAVIVAVIVVVRVGRNSGCSSGYRIVVGGRVLFILNCIIWPVR